MKVITTEGQIEGLFLYLGRRHGQQRRRWQTDARGQTHDGRRRGRDGGGDERVVPQDETVHRVAVAGGGHDDGGCMALE